MSRNITICNFKGGVGKSIIAHQLITGFKFSGVEIDPYGSLADRVEGVLRDENLASKNLPKSKFKKTVFDFGGFDTQKLVAAADYSDLILVPFIATMETVQGTMDTLSRVKDFGKPILLVANMCHKDTDVEDAKGVFSEHLGFEVEVGSIPHSIGLQTAINDNLSVIDLSKQKGLKGFMYKKIAESFNKLYKQIDSYLK